MPYSLNEMSKFKIVKTSICKYLHFMYGTEHVHLKNAKTYFHVIKVECLICKGLTGVSVRRMVIAVDFHPLALTVMGSNPDRNFEFFFHVRKLFYGTSVIHSGARLCLI
jgi:hypothetical protein